jgi:hypothetical protein
MNIARILVRLAKGARDLCLVMMRTSAREQLHQRIEIAWLSCRRECENYSVTGAGTTVRNCQIELTWKRTRRHSIC